MGEVLRPVPGNARRHGQSGLVNSPKSLVDWWYPRLRTHHESNREMVMRDLRSRHRGAGFPPAGDAAQDYEHLAFAECDTAVAV
jgi:hypothetical protein